MEKPNEPMPGWVYVTDWARQEGISRERAYQIARQIGGKKLDGRWIIPSKVTREYRNRALRWIKGKDQTTVSAILYTGEGCPRCGQINTVMRMNFPEESKVCMACKIIFTHIVKKEDNGL